MPHSTAQRSEQLQLSEYAVAERTQTTTKTIKKKTQHNNNRRRFLHINRTNMPHKAPKYSEPAQDVGKLARARALCEGIGGKEASPRRGLRKRHKSHASERESDTGRSECKNEGARGICRGMVTNRRT